MATECTDFTFIFIRTSDEMIGVVIAIPRNGTAENAVSPELWGRIRGTAASGKPISLREVWVPGFRVECETEYTGGKISAHRVVNKVLGNKNLCRRRSTRKESSRRIVRSRMRAD